MGVVPQGIRRRWERRGEHVAPGVAQVDCRPARTHTRGAATRGCGWRVLSRTSRRVRRTSRDSTHIPGCVTARAAPPPGCSGSWATARQGCAAACRLHGCGATGPRYRTTARRRASGRRRCDPVPCKLTLYPVKWLRVAHRHRSGWRRRPPARRSRRPRRSPPARDEKYLRSHLSQRLSSQRR